MPLRRVCSRRPQAQAYEPSPVWQHVRMLEWQRARGPWDEKASSANQRLGQVRSGRPKPTRRCLPSPDPGTHARTRPLRQQTESTCPGVRAMFDCAACADGGEDKIADSLCPAGGTGCGRARMVESLCPTCAMDETDEDTGECTTAPRSAG